MRRLAIDWPLLGRVTPRSPRETLESMDQSRTILLASLAILTLQLSLISKASAQAELSLSQGTSFVLVSDKGPAIRIQRLARLLSPAPLEISAAHSTPA